MALGISLGFWILILGFPVFGDGIGERIEAEIRSFVISERPEWRDEDIKISFSGAEDLIVSFADDENIDVEVQDGYKLSKITPRMLVPIAFVLSGEKRKYANIWIKIEIFKDVVVAAKRIKRNSAFSKGDLEVKKKEVAMFPPNYYDDTDKLSSMAAKSNIQEGSVIFEWMVKEKPVMLKNSKIKISVIGGNLMVEADGIALEDGQIGDKIKVRRADSGKVLDAEVVGAGQVEVKL